MHPIPARGHEPAHHHFDVRFLIRAEDERFRVSEESHALAWVPADGVGALSDRESVLRLARKWLARERGRGQETAAPVRGSRTLSVHDR